MNEKEILIRNNSVSWKLCDYLNDSPCFVTKELIQEVDPDGVLPLEKVYLALVSGACGLDPDTLPEDRLQYEYFEKSIKLLNPQEYLDNPYYKNIIIPTAKIGKWELGYQKYAPFEAFLRDDIKFEGDYVEIPQIGFFSEEFEYPSVLEEGREWMSIKPSELNSLVPSIVAAFGDVITFGLGLGYYAYMSALKKNVKSVTVVERSEQVISLFEQYILPQFGDCSSKIKIIRSDAFEYVKTQMPKAHYDIALVDLWHDTADGLEPYKRMKELEYLAPSTQFNYWADNSLRSAIRWNKFIDGTICSCLDLQE